jgi:hypothetical protein
VEQEEGEALEDEEQSDASFAKSVACGVAACWDACLATPTPVDVVCDIIGGTTSVGLEALAAKEASEAAALIAAAARAEAKEKSELTLAAELQSVAAEMASWQQQIMLRQ